MPRFLHRSIEVGAAGAFEPEYLPAEARQFQIGTLLFQAAGVCRRCPVPERNSLTGDPSHFIRDQFEAFRTQRLPASVDASTWTDFYRLGINTNFRGNPGSIKTGQLIEIYSR